MLLMHTNSQPLDLLIFLRLNLLPMLWSWLHIDHQSQGHVDVLDVFLQIDLVSTSKCPKHFGRCILKGGGLLSFVTSLHWP